MTPQEGVVVTLGPGGGLGEQGLGLGAVAMIHRGLGGEEKAEMAGAAGVEIRSRRGGPYRRAGGQNQRS
jgi:hypothetical protein